MHQPLHVVSRVNPSYPLGDLNGYQFRLPKKGKIGNLHNVYDSLMYKFPYVINPPLTYEDVMQIKFDKDSILMRHPIVNILEDANIDSLSFVLWQ